MQKPVSSFYSFFLFIFFSLPPAIFAQNQLWQSFTNMRTVRGYHEPGTQTYIFSRLLVSSPQGVWAATTGGVLLWDAERQGFRRFTNTDGLRQNATKALGRDNRGRIWIFLATGTIAQPAGLIDIFDPAQNSFTRINEYRDLNIYDFAARGDSMYIALKNGISLYDIGRSEVKETYKNLGIFPRETAVQALFFDGRELWAATSLGVARTSLNLPNLLAPESWTNYTTAEGLPSPVVRGFAKFSQSLVAATANGVAAFTGQRWTNISGDIGNREILQVAAGQENGKAFLYAATPSGVFRTETATPGNTWSRVGSGLSIVTGMVIDNAGTLWVSTYDNGLYEFDRNSQTWVLHEPEGPATNSFSSVSLDLDGNLWGTSSTNGLQIYDGARWYNYKSPALAIWPDVRQVVHLANGEHWVATWGGGIYVLTGPVNALAIARHIDASNGLSTALGLDNFPAVPFLKLDAQNNIWILNFNAANTNALLTRTPADNFFYFSTSDGLRSTLVSALEIEKREDPLDDRVWVGTDNSGASVFAYNGVVQNKADVKDVGELDLDDNLLSNKVTSLAHDRDGYVWIGTDKGLNYFFESGGANDRFCYSLISDDVKIVKVDPRNNKWVGTSAGITVLSGENFCETTDYTVGNSPLVGNIVTGFAFNGKTGDVWIGTTTGLSLFRTPFTEPKPNLEQLKGYPNPLILEAQSGASGECVFRFSNLTNDSAVKIYNIAGELVRSYTADEVRQRPCWDGRDASAKLVPSGVYLFVAVDEILGASGVGKIAVVRR